MSNVKDILVANKKLIAFGAVAIGVALAAQATRSLDADLVEVAEDIVSPNGEVEVS